MKKLEGRYRDTEKEIWKGVTIQEGKRL